MSDRKAQSKLVSIVRGRDACPMNQSEKRDLEEVMDFDPEEGILDLETHLDRLKSQADSLGYEFDRHSARNELQAATFGKRSPGKARLLVSPSGAMAIEMKRS
jgi:hypothetical protein